MRRVFLSALVLASLLAGAAPCRAQQPALRERTKKFKNSRRWDVRYDKFDDVTTVRVGPFFVSAELLNPNNNLQLYTGFSFAGSGEPKTVEEFQLLFVSNSDDRWNYLDDSTLKAIVDGERVSLGEATRKSDVGRRLFGEINLKESLLLRVPRATFERLARAERVEMRLGRKEIKIKDEHLQAFRDLLSLSPAASQNQEPSHDRAD